MPLHSIELIVGEQLNYEPAKVCVSGYKYVVFAHMFSAEGISPDPKKGVDLQVITASTNVTEVRSLLSSTAFCARLIKDLAVITKPLRRLTCKDEPWKWGDKEQTALENLKTALSHETTHSYFNPEKPTSVYINGSPVGLRAALTQKDPDSGKVNPLHYASYPLNATKAHYLQIDCEALSIYWPIK